MKNSFKDGWSKKMDKLILNSSFERGDGFAINCYIDNGKLFSKYIMTHIASAAGRNGYLYKVSEITKLYPGVSVSFGKGCIYTVAKPCLKNKLPLIYIDHAYFDRGYRWKKAHGPRPSNFRILMNEIHPTKIIERSSDRFESFNINLKPWKKGGEHILICPPTGFLTEITDLDPNWTFNTISTLREHTDRRIVIRPKPGITLIEPFIQIIKKFKNVDLLMNTNGRPLNEDFYKCWAVIAPASAVSVEAIIQGVPVFTEPFSPAAPTSLFDYSKIEAPIYPDREPLLYSLAYNQFSMSEIESGYALEMLIDDHSDIFLNFKKERKALKRIAKSNA